MLEGNCCWKGGLACGIFNKIHYVKDWQFRGAECDSGGIPRLRGRVGIAECVVAWFGYGLWSKVSSLTAVTEGYRLAGDES